MCQPSPAPITRPSQRVEYTRLSEKFELPARPPHVSRIFLFQFSSPLDGMLVERQRAGLVAGPSRRIAETLEVKQQARAERHVVGVGGRKL